MTMEWSNPSVTLRMDGNGSWTYVGIIGAEGNLLRSGEAVPAAYIEMGGKWLPASGAQWTDGILWLTFADSTAIAHLRVSTEEHTVTFEVVRLEQAGDAERLIFVHLPLRLEGRPGEPAAASLLALNLHTNVPEIPGLGSKLQAAAYSRFGFAGAKAALVACPQERMREVLKTVISGSGSLPVSALGGPWAMDAPLNRGSYLFDFGDIRESNVEEWIRLARELGINQIDFHGGVSFRFGDLRPNPDIYPEGLDSLKRVVDRLHEAGIAAGLHTYAYFIDKSSEWVSPVPHPDLAKQRVFTLAAAVGEDEDEIEVLESTANLSLETGFHIRNSVTVQIGQELIQFSGTTREKPYRLTGCVRGAHGTRVTGHAAGEPVHLLKECFHLFVPDGDSGLFDVVAERTADVYNHCGFDMIYLDALDGQDIFAGPEFAWHYASKFVFAICGRLHKPALMEMSCFHHHLWYVRSRANAWDFPVRGYKRFVDIHAEVNQESLSRNFLPGHLGWWAMQGKLDEQSEALFTDDMEYLCGKALATDTGLSMMFIKPEHLTDHPYMAKLAGIVRAYETLRHEVRGRLSDKARSMLAETGAEFRLKTADGESRLFPAKAITRVLHVVEGRPAQMRLDNPFGSQTPKLRLQLLASADPQAEERIVLLKGDEPPERFEVKEADGAALDIRTDWDDGRGSCVSFSASSESADASWVRARFRFDGTVDMEQRSALGAWIWGDGSGAVLNLQLRARYEALKTLGEHYLALDFTGWRYVTFVEDDGGFSSQHAWPYDHRDLGSSYTLYREKSDYRQTVSLDIWLGRLPSGRSVSCKLRLIEALPLRDASADAPELTINGMPLRLPARMRSGSFIEYDPEEGTALYGPDLQLIERMEPAGEAPALLPGENRIELRSAGSGQEEERWALTAIVCDERPVTLTGPSGDEPA